MFNQLYNLLTSQVINHFCIRLINQQISLLGIRAIAQLLNPLVTQVDSPALVRRCSRIVFLPQSRLVSHRKSRLSSRQDNRFLTDPLLNLKECRRDSLRCSLLHSQLRNQLDNRLCNLPDSQIVTRASSLVLYQPSNQATNHLVFQHTNHQANLPNIQVINQQFIQLVSPRHNQASTLLGNRAYSRYEYHLFNLPDHPASNRHLNQVNQLVSLPVSLQNIPHHSPPFVQPFNQHSFPLFNQPSSLQSNLLLNLQSSRVINPLSSPPSNQVNSQL